MACPEVSTFCNASQACNCLDVEMPHDDQHQLHHDADHRLQCNAMRCLSAPRI